MGSEARCTARHAGRVSEGKAHLDAEEIVFRGDFRLVVPFKSVTAAGAEGGRLILRWNGEEAELELGAAAAKWAEKIRNPKAVIDKLGVKRGCRVAFFGEPDPEFRGELCARAAPLAPVDVLFLYAERREELERLVKLEAHLKPDGAIWVIRPRGRQEITEADVIQAGKAAGLVDVKVVRFSETHTAEKLVIPVARRGAR
jgi:hypothetical protein